MSWAAAAAIAAPVVGGLVGNLMGQKDRSAAKKAMQQALAELEQVGLPPNMAKELIFKEFEQVGILTPELEEDLHLAESEYATLKEDPTLRTTQLEALNRFKQQSTGGLAGDERAALNDILGQTRQDVRAKQDQILADSQRRGMGGSGMSLIAQLQASQAGADQSADQGMDLMGLLAQRVRQGTSDMANTAQNMRSQDYQVASDRAKALDARNEYLHQNSQARQARNIATKNDAMAANLQNKQRVSEMNTNLANQEKLRQAEAERQYWQDKFGLAQAKANAQTGQANMYNQQADRTAQMYSGIGQGVGQGISGYAKDQQATKNSQAQSELDWYNARTARMQANKS
jgi:hypothetical protein